MPVSLAETETEHMIKVLNVVHGYCVNKQPIQGFTQCSGACNSGSKYNKCKFFFEEIILSFDVNFIHFFLVTLGQDKICHCCNIKSYKQITVSLMCEDGYKIEQELEIPASCGCQPCSDSVEYLSKIGQYALPMAEFIRR